MAKRVVRPKGILKRHTPTFIDLFSGCGGFTLGMLRAGFRCLATADSDDEATTTLRTNLRAVEHVLQKDLTAYTPEELASVIGTQHVDVIVGGPPCQGFSTARQVDGANHGARLKKDDPRRELYKEYLRFVEYFQPKVFVIENVLGIRSAAGGNYLTNLMHEARILGQTQGRPGYRVHCQAEDAWELGVPQKRRRLLVIGVRADLHGYFRSELKPVSRAQSRTPLGTAICDLPPLEAGTGLDECDYDLRLRSAHLKQHGNIAEKFMRRVLEVHHAKKLTNHVARPHNDRDIRDFKRLLEGESSAVAMRKRNVEFEFPYDKSSFKDRYTRQSRTGPCSTIVAHMSKDGLMFIHPTQHRSLTPREAARTQSFPDWFRFPSARTHAYRLIGNAVPPLVAEAIGSAVRQFLGMQSSRSKQKTNGIKQISAQTRLLFKDIEIGSATSYKAEDRNTANILSQLAKLDRSGLRSMTDDHLLQYWHLLLASFPDLHPDNAVDHGRVLRPSHDCRHLLPGLPVKMHQRYARSGWPVALVAMGTEVWRRLKLGSIQPKDLYGS